MKRVIITIIIIAVVAGGWYAYKEYNRKNANLATVKADERVTTSELLNSFENDSTVGNKRYLGKILEVKGKVKAIETTNEGTTIVLGEASQMSSVRCSMDSTYTREPNIKEGMKLTVKGNCTGFNKNDIAELGSDVILTRCVISK